jgi:hypothetical protein
MNLTFAQRQTLRADILAAADQPTIDARTAEDWGAVATIYNTIAAPALWAWRSNVSRVEVYTKQNDLAVSGEQTGFFKWDVFKAQSATEQTAFIQMFMGDQANFSAQNLRDGIKEIFKGTAANLAMQAHILAVGRRTVTRLEKLFAVGTGTTASPSVMAVEGTVTAQQVSDAMAGL